MPRRAFLAVYGGFVVAALILAWVVPHGVKENADTRTLAAMALPVFLAIYARSFNVLLRHTFPAYALAAVVFWSGIVGPPLGVVESKGHALMAVYFVLIGSMVHHWDRH